MGKHVSEIFRHTNTNSPVRYFSVSFPFQNGTAPGLRASLEWKSSTGLEPIRCLWDERTRRLRARRDQPTSVLDLADAVVSEREQIPAAGPTYAERVRPKDWSSQLLVSTKGCFLVVCILFLFFL